MRAQDTVELREVSPNDRLLTSCEKRQPFGDLPILHSMPVNGVLSRVYGMSCRLEVKANEARRCAA